MKDLFNSQKQIKRIYEKGIPTPRLQMYREGIADPSETLFVAHVPSSMVKQILNDHDLWRNKYDDDL